MRTEYGKCKISIYGSAKDIAAAQKVLDAIELVDNEPLDRIAIQNAIDDYGIKASILYDGNTVWSYNRIIRDFKKALKNGPSQISEYGNGDYCLTDYLYEFLSLSCGSIAHYNKYGWIGTYPTKADLKRFMFRNEFGQDIASHQPHWKTDAIRIAKELIKLSGGK